MAKAVFLVFCLFYFTITNFASAKAEQPLPIEIPQTFKLTLSEFGSPSYTVQLFTDGLHIKTRDGAKVKTRVVRPDHKAWLKFVNKLNEFKLYRWAPDYPDPGVPDGQQWKVKMSFGERIIVSEGSNSYPKDGEVELPQVITDNRFGPSHVFQSFMAAVEELAAKP